MDSGTVIFLVIVGATVAQLLVKKFRKGKGIQGARGSAAPPGDEDEKEDPNQDLVDQLFGPYIERRKKEYAARQAAAAPPREAVPAAPSRPPPARAAVATAPRPPRPGPSGSAPARPPRAPSVAASKAPPPPPAPPVQLSLPEPHRHSLEARLFRNRTLSQGAKLILASEILSRPKYLRR